jgi:hypothetical protein
MISGIDKALVALVMGGIGVTNAIGWTHFGLSESTISMVVGGLTPLLVWLTPNKKL